MAHLELCELCRVQISKGDVVSSLCGGQIGWSRALNLELNVGFFRVRNNRGAKFMIDNLGRNDNNFHIFHASKFRVRPTVVDRCLCGTLTDMGLVILSS